MQKSLRLEGSLLNYSNFLKEGHSSTPALQPFIVLTGVFHFFPSMAAPYINYSMTWGHEFTLNQSDDGINVWVRLLKEAFKTMSAWMIFKKMKYINNAFSIHF